MQLALKILEENSIRNAIIKFEVQKIENEGAKVLLGRVNELYLSQREMVCKWIVSVKRISIEYKFHAYNILGCTLEDEEIKILNFKNALNLGVEQKYDISDPLINLQKIYLRQKQYEKVIRFAKYDQFLGRHKVVALQNQARAYFGLNLIDECQEFSKRAFQECKTLYGAKDPMTIRLSEYLNLLQVSQCLNKIQQTSNQQNQARISLQDRQQKMNQDFGKTFTQFEFQSFTNNIQMENSNTQQLRAQFFHKNGETNTQDNQNFCCQLIREFFKLADITIIIKNFELNATCQQLIIKYKDLLQNIDYEDEQLLEQISQVQIKQDEIVTNNNKYTYQLQPQNENNISQLDKMIYIQNAIIQSFLIESIQKDINFKMDQKLFQYQMIQGSKQKLDEISDFFKRLKNTLDQTVILTYNCLSEKEAFRIKIIFNQKIVYKNVIKQLNVEDLWIILSSDINLDDFQLYTHLQQQAQKIKSQTNQIILICILVKPVNIEKLQKQFQELVLKCSNLQLIRDQFEIELEFKPDENVIDEKVKQLQQSEEQFDIQVSQPQIKLDNKKMFVVNSLIQFWMDSKNEQIDEVKQKFAKLKYSIFQIYFPSQDIILTDEKQINLWQRFLYQFYSNPKESYTINTQLLIELKGESTLIEEKYQLILSDLTEFQCKRYNFEVQEIIAQTLAEKKNLEKLFKSSLEKISKLYDKCLIQIVGVNEKIILVDIYINDQIKLNNIQKQLQQEFFNQLNILIEKNFEIEDLYCSLGMQKQQFKDEYQVEVSKINKEYYFICQNIHLDEIKKVIVKAKQYKKENRKTKIIECQNILIFNELKENYILQSNAGNQDILFNYSQSKKIILQAMNQQLLEEQSLKTLNDINNFQNQLKSKICILQEKQVKFFKKHFSQYYTNLENERKAAIKFQTNNYYFISQVLYQDKKIHLVEADITLLECDAIVNFHFSQNQNMEVSGLTQKILNFGGQLYQSYYYNFLTNTTHTQNQFGITTFELSPFCNIRYIVNLIIPSECNIDFNDPQSIYQIIDSLFNETRKHNEISKLALPIFNICKSEKLKIKTYLNAIINKIFNNETTVRQIYIAEIDKQYIQFVDSILQNTSIITNNSKPKWQWKDVITFVNYSEDINNQINDAYERFLKSNQETTINLKFQIENKPSTHSVDLKKLKIKEISSNSESQIIYRNQNNKITYIINQEELDAELTNYFINMYNKQCFQFDIFWKNLDVVINNQGIYQLNTRTQFQRPIQKIPNQQDNMEQKQRITQFKINYKYESQNQILIQSFDSKLNDLILNEIKQKLQESQISLKINIPLFSNTQSQKLTEYLDTVAQKVQGKVISGQLINIEIFKNKEKKIFKQLDLIKSLANKEYPKEWIDQDQNFIKVQLDQNSSEYQKIKGLFEKTDKGTIKAIFRIQNKTLWDNYILERNKLIDLCAKQKRLLLPQEQERYLWHGVSQQHPSIIYKSLAEAFDVTFSRVGLWGQGIYFAENAFYSRYYSYKLTVQDDSNYAGNLVFLCCLVTTGRSEQKNECKDIKKPSDGYDCVTGMAKNSQIFILYQMHVRRAYPAYEVIFQ
ncbi:unnamed protein product [Paramecium pentaurelia]|uniref:PARP catalytic domain-containing protein n=1 Tax=Paramecium pentaurelia TaxID=43138 RepID=A0A8S1UCD2_9CILI|nr:unnamed protein product [Paramecium pentaurelia]